MSKRGNQKPWEPNARAVLKRRVAALLTRGLAEHEIVQSLCSETRPGPDGAPQPNPSLTINPKTGKPYAQTTISRIKRELLDEWRRKDIEKLGEHYARLIGENLEARRVAWAVGDIAEVRILLDQMAGWIGANKPIKLEMDIGALDAAIEQGLAELAARGESGSAESYNADAGETEGA